MSPTLLAGFRVALAAMFLAGLTARRSPGGWSKNLFTHQWPKFLVLAVFNAVIPYVLIASGEQHITSGLAAIFNATTPLFSFGLGYLAGSRKNDLGASGLFGLVLGIGGVGILVGGGSRGDIASEIAVIVASASYAVAGNYAKRTFEGQPILVPALGQNLVATVVLMPVALLFFRPSHVPSLASILAILALGLAGTGLAYVLYYWLIATAGATRTLTVTYLLPVTALFYGAVFLGEHVGWREVAGMIAILVGVSGTSGFLRRRQPLLSAASGRSAVRSGHELDSPGEGLGA